MATIRPAACGLVGEHARRSFRYSRSTAAGRPRREAEQQVGVAVGVDVTEGRGAGRPGIGHAGGRGDVGEGAGVVAIEAIGRAVEAHEQVEIAVAVDVGERVHQVGAGPEQVGLHRRERHGRIIGGAERGQDGGGGDQAEEDDDSTHGRW